jgi:hypothetical protein
MCDADFAVQTNHTPCVDWKFIIYPVPCGNELYWQCCGNRLLWLCCGDGFLSCLVTNCSTMPNCINCTACVVMGLNWLRCGNYNALLNKSCSYCLCHFVLNHTGVTFIVSLSAAAIIECPGGCRFSVRQCCLVEGHNYLTKIGNAGVAW